MLKHTLNAQILESKALLKESSLEIHESLNVNPDKL